MDEKKPNVMDAATITSGQTVATVNHAPSLEELQKQLDALKAENETLKADAEKVKKTISNANADAASWKDKYRSTLDEAKRKEEERAEADAALRDELNALKAEKRISTYTARLMEVGYDAQTAATMAISLPEGISDDFFESQKKFLESQKQIAKTEALNSQPGLSVGTPPVSVDKETADIRRWMGLSQK